MEIFRRRERMEPTEIEALAGLRPLFDPVFDHLLEGACKGTVDVYFAAVPFGLIRPFDPDYDPCKHPVGEAAVRELMDRWRKGDFQKAWVYQKRQEFLLSDDYIVWEAARRGRPDYVPCWILGRPLHPDLRDVQGPIDSREIPALLGFVTDRDRPPPPSKQPQPTGRPSEELKPSRASAEERSGMRFSLGLWDWLFGEKATIELPDGRTRTVTVKWMREMGRQGALTQVPPPIGEMIDVHMLGRGDALDDAGTANIDDWFAKNRRTYRHGRWCIGKDVSAEQVRQHWDKDTGSLYVFYKIVDDQWKGFFLTRQKFEELRRLEERLMP